MARKYKSPLNTGDLDSLTALAEKANRATLRDGLVPFYVAADGGDDDHPNGWIFLAWPAEFGPSRNMAQHLFADIRLLCDQYLGADMAITAPAEENDDAE
jgi:hypothetical protein